MAHMIDFQNLTQIQRQSLMREEELENKYMSTLKEGLESQLDPDFFQDNNDVQKQAKTATKYSNTKVRTRNLLRNVSHRRYKPEDVKEKRTLLSMFFRF